jgi:dolichol-phosphate mannosyltransferase
MAAYLGFFAATLSILAIPIVVVLRLTGFQAFLGQATTLITVLFLGGVQLISLGILGEYIGRLYDEAKGRPLYIVREAPPDQFIEPVSSLEVDRPVSNQGHSILQNKE